MTDNRSTSERDKWEYLELFVDITGRTAITHTQEERPSKEILKDTDTGD